MNKIIAKSIFLFVILSLPSCTCFCVFRPELEEIVEHFIEEEINHLSEDALDSMKKPEHPER